MKHILSLFFMLLSFSVFAQGDTGSNDFFKSNLKVYVVIGVGIIILSCLFAFLFALERRLKILEEKK